jgi:integrase
VSDGVKRVRKRLADGTVRVYEYPRAKAPPRVQRRPAAPAGDTIGALIDVYVRSPQYRRLAANSQRLYDRALREIRDAHGNDLVLGIRRRLVRAMLDLWADKPTTHNTLLTVWRVLLQRAVEDEWIDSNPTAGLEHLPTGTRERWTDAQVDYALRHAPEWMRRAIVLALATGQRAGDLVAMRWGQYDGAAVSLRQQKTAADLQIPLSSEMRAELDAWRREARTLTILSTPRGLPWKRGVFYSKTSLWLSGHLALAGCTMHGLRHTTASRLAEAGATAVEIQAVTGHRNLSTVARYTRGVDQRAAAEAAVRKLTTRPVTR